MRGRGARGDGGSVQRLLRCRCAGGATHPSHAAAPDCRPNAQRSQQRPSLPPFSRSFCCSVALSPPPFRRAECAFRPAPASWGARGRASRLARAPGRWGPQQGACRVVRRGSRRESVGARGVGASPSAAFFPQGCSPSTTNTAPLHHGCAPHEHGLPWMQRGAPPAHLPHCCASKVVCGGAMRRRGRCSDRRGGSWRVWLVVERRQGVRDLFVHERKPFTARTRCQGLILAQVAGGAQPPAPLRPSRLPHMRGSGGTVCSSFLSVFVTFPPQAALRGVWSVILVWWGWLGSGRSDDLAGSGSDREIVHGRW